MSDYLWDRTGEPDQEARHLEDLLGDFAHRPRPLNLPVVVAAAPPARTHRFRALFPFGIAPRYRVAAIAAALVLMILTGAALSFIYRRDQSAEPRASSATAPQQQPPRIEHGAPAGTVRTTEHAAARAPEKTASPTVASIRRSRQRSRRHSRDDRRGGGGEELAGRTAGPSGGGEETLTAEQRRAKDQLMLALRVAGANLGYVRRQVHEISLPNDTR